MTENAIGIYDSGFGGLSVAKQVMELMPHENIVFLGDTKRMPYGDNEPETIVRYSLENSAFLLSKNVKLIVAACGTSCSCLSPDFARNLAVPFVGIIEPAAKAAAKKTRTKKVGVIATSATIKSGSFLRSIKAIDSDISVFGQECPELVPLIESGKISAEDKELVEALHGYIAPILQSGCDTLILGCTHFNLISDVISFVSGGALSLVDTGVETALEIKRIIDSGNLCGGSGLREFYSTGSANSFAKLAKIFLSRDVSDFVSHANLDAICTGRGKNSSPSDFCISAAQGVKHELFCE
ncbi:MAG: glutamate racemase [Oscillospiraceae bacterium]